MRDKVIRNVSLSYRFLNLITDSTVGNKAPASMNQLARKYEIPEWIVDIRHAVAHGPLLPNLYSLEKAVEKCLNWLYVSGLSEVEWRIRSLKKIQIQSLFLISSRNLIGRKTCTWTLYQIKMKLALVQRSRASKFASLSRNTYCSVSKVLSM